MRRLIPLCLGALWLPACGLAQGATAPPPTDETANPAPVWADEFDGVALDRTKWTPEESCWGGGNNERQCYVDSAETIRVDNGVLTLSALPKRHTGPTFPPERGDRGERVTQDFVSGKVRTRGLAHWTYGRFEARIKLPQGQSTWPAFWMLPEDDRYGGWPLSGEIDIMEAVNLGATCAECPDGTENRTSGALHFGKLWPHNQFRVQTRDLPVDEIDNWHIYAVDWREDRIEWSVDGNVFFSAEPGDWFTDAVSQADNPRAPFDQPFYLMLNLAVGGNLPDNKNEAAFNPESFPAQMQIDWVRVYP